MVDCSLNMAEKTSEKTVLCCLKEHKVTVTYSKGSIEELTQAVRDEFTSGAIPTDSTVFFQLKSEDWDGEFIDVKKDDDIPDRSVLRVVVEKPNKVQYWAFASIHPLWARVNYVQVFFSRFWLCPGGNHLCL